MHVSITEEKSMSRWCYLLGRWTWGRQIQSHGMEYGVGHEGESDNQVVFSQKET